MSDERSSSIDEEAARWVIRQDRGAWTPAEQAELEAWCAADSRRRGALFRAQAAWAGLDRASVFGRAAGQGHVIVRPRLSRRVVLGLGATGAAAAAGLAAVAVMVPSGARYRTAVGEVRTIALPDGSRVVINTASELEADLQKDGRRLRLDRGEAWFEVVRDPERPFVVAMGPAQVRAIGTAFSARRRPGGTEVLVTEGAVAVRSRIAFARPPVHVGAGYRIFVSDLLGPQQSVRAVAEIDRALAWRSGQIVLDGDTLGEAVAEFNRYNARKIVLEDPNLAGERLVGWFRTDEPESFATAAARMLGLRVFADREVIRLAPAAPARKFDV
jgi:transmembrane sensor